MKVKLFLILGISAIELSLGLVVTGCMTNNIFDGSSLLEQETFAERNVRLEEVEDPSSVLAFIDNWDQAGTGVALEVGKTVSLVGKRGSVLGAMWWWRSESIDHARDTFIWSVKDDGGTGATIVRDTITTIGPGTVIITAAVSDGAGKGRNLTRDFALQSLNSKVTIGDYVVREAQNGWYLDSYLGREANVVIPTSLGITEIGIDSFSGKQFITSISIPEGVTKIHNGAFSRNANLKLVTLPSTLQVIEDRAFYGCGIISISIPFGVTAIGSRAFFTCQNLTSITIPASVTTISIAAFGDSPSLTAITIQAEKPPFIVFHTYFDYVEKSLAWGSPVTGIYVPAASVEAYKKADGWNQYAEFIREF